MRVTVPLGDRSYDVVVEHGARFQLEQLIRQRAPDAQFVVVVASTSVQRQPWFRADTGVAQAIVTVPDGEAAKQLSTVESLCTEFSNLGLSRRDVVVAVGGGATTDVAGFAAAAYLRGVAVVHVATSLVAQVDAAIGGKTGVNLSVGKNLVGAFHQPIGVLCDLDTLATLPSRERLSGLGEVAKCWLLNSLNAQALEETPFEELVRCAVQLKADIVSSDEHEGGQRALLNYGHTLAHALEAEQLSGRPGDLRHGEAVAVGVAFAVRLARDLGRVSDEAVADSDRVLDYFELPRSLPAGADVERLVTAMGHDKKAHHNLTFVLAGQRGFESVADVAATDVLSVLRAFESER